MAIAEDEGLIVALLARQREGGVEVARDQHALVVHREVRVAAEHDGGATGQGPSDRLPGLPPHDEAVSHRELLDGLLLVGQAPGDLRGATDHAVLGQGRDDGQLHRSAQTAIGALMPLSGS